MSTSNSIAVVWTKITGDTLPVMGYKLYADSGLDDDFKLVFDGSIQPETTTFNYSRTNMDTSLIYRFYVTGINFNGEGLKSDIAYLKPCTLPSLLDRPKIMDLTTTKIAISWTAPKKDGGCQI